MRAQHISKIGLTVPVLAALVLSGCGSEDEPAASTSSPSSAVAETPAGPSFNTADVQFANGMIPHHAQAVEMAELALTRATSPKVKEIAEQVKTGQGAEIETLTGLLTGWGETVPSADDSGSMDGMDHEAAGHSGMMTDGDMGDLEGDQVWVDLMITHHEGAVEMSEAEVQAGSSPQAKQLAQTIADTQTQEITELQSIDLS